MTVSVLSTFTLSVKDRVTSTITPTPPYPPIAALNNSALTLGLAVTISPDASTIFIFLTDDIIAP